MIEPTGARTLHALTAAISRYSPVSLAWRDYVIDCHERLKSKPNASDNAVVPDDLWDYWSLVAEGQNRDYDADGARTIED